MGRKAVVAVVSLLVGAVVLSTWGPAGLAHVLAGDARSAATTVAAPASPAPAPVAVITTTTAPAPTTTAPPAPTTAPPTPGVLRTGAEGEAVQRLQTRLGQLGYWVAGGADGRYGSTTVQAVMAFQKAQGLAADGIAGPATLDALAAASRPLARSGAGTGRVVEIDLARQLLLVVADGVVVEAFNTSTGAPGWTTPTGRFAVDREVDGVRHAPLGDLYRPKYFHRGIAVHGAAEIPAHPASHGCARVHDRAMDHLWETGALAIGTPVWVY